MGTNELLSESLIEDATQIFTPESILNDQDDFGTLTIASVSDSFIHQMHGMTSVLIRILPIGRHAASVLRQAVKNVSGSAQQQILYKYLGVWDVSPTETWLVMERKPAFSVKSLFETTTSNDIESVISYIAFSCLTLIRSLHNDHDQPHGNINPGNIYLSLEDTSVFFSDAGIYNVLSEYLRERRSAPGLKIWPFEAQNGKTASIQEDIWDLGTALLEIMDGGAALSQMMRYSHHNPRPTNPSRWSAQLNSFLNLIFAVSSDDNFKDAHIDELLLHRFVSDVSPSACQAAVAEHISTSGELSQGNFVQDTISVLYRQNTVVVQAPLISIDDISTDQFSYDKWRKNDISRPTVEMSFLRMLRVSKERPQIRDNEESAHFSNKLSAIETFLEMVET